MTFRNSAIDEVVIIEGLKKEAVAEKIQELANKHIIVDLQYAVSDKGLFKAYKHHAILLIQRKN